MTTGRPTFFPGSLPRGHSGVAGSTSIIQGGLSASLSGQSLDDSALVCFADEMRLGLVSQVRRRWGLRGVRLVQPMQMRFEWRWLSLALCPLSGRLFWGWQKNLRKEGVAQTVASWKAEGADVLVWDNAPAHRSGLVRASGAGMLLCFLPPFSPELNPAERLFEEVRRAVEGPVYETLDEKIAAVEAFLTELDADPERVRRLCGWSWIVSALQSLPEPLHYQGA